jgi:hypothetical protein
MPSRATTGNPDLALMGVGSGMVQGALGMDEVLSFYFNGI